MIDVDVDELRQANIRLHRLTKVDEVYTFYYDETNNIRKLHVTPSGLNVGDPGCFVLGGIVHRGPPNPVGITSLRASLRLQPSTNEIKLKHLGKGNFLSLLKSPKVSAMLEWLIHQDFLVHIHVLDVVYWSIVDIVDSVVVDCGQPILMMTAAEIKDVLYTALRLDLPGTVGVFNRFRYPGLKPEDGKDFVTALRNVVEPQLPRLPTRHASLLVHFLDVAEASEGLPFIEGYEAHVLIDDFSSFYLHRLCLFKNSTHLLDTEEVIRAKLLDYRLHQGGVPLQHFQFVDSITEPAIQISDLVAGLFGKYYSYLASTTVAQVAEDKAGLNEVQEKSRGLLKRLVDSSDSENPAFFHYVTSLSERRKDALFLHSN